MQEFWGLKKGEGICPKVAHFQELTACACERERRGGMREMTGVCGAVVAHIGLLVACVCVREGEGVA